MLQFEGRVRCCTANPVKIHWLHTKCQAFNRVPAEREKPCRAITVDDNLNCNRQPPRHTHTRHSFTQSTLSSVVAIVIPKPITGLHLLSLRSRKPELKIAPIIFALWYVGSSSLQRHTEILYLSTDTEDGPPPHSPTHPPPNLEERQHYKSIYKLWEASARGGKWTMADEGYWKTASCRHSGQTGARDWNRLVCSRQRDTNGVFAWTCVNSETRTRGDGTAE